MVCPPEVMMKYALVAPNTTSPIPAKKSILYLSRLKSCFIVLSFQLVWNLKRYYHAYKRQRGTYVEISINVSMQDIYLQDSR